MPLGSPVGAAWVRQVSACSVGQGVLAYAGDRNGVVSDGMQVVSPPAEAPAPLAFEAAEIQMLPPSKRRAVANATRITQRRRCRGLASVIGAGAYSAPMSLPPSSSP